MLSVWTIISERPNNASSLRAAKWSGRHRLLHSIINSQVTCYFISDKFTGLNFSDAPKQTLQLFLGHVLRQIVDYQVSFTVLYHPRLYRRGAVVWNWRRAVARIVARWTVGQLRFHGSNNLLKRQERQMKTTRKLINTPGYYLLKKDALRTLKHLVEKTSF